MYWNNSPDDLNELYFHLYQNAFTPNSYCSELHNQNQKEINYGRYEKEGLGTVVKNLKVSYMHSCKLDDKINLVTDLENINRAKLCFRHIFYKDKKEISKIQVTVCCISNTGKVARMPKSLYHKFIN